MPWESDQSCPRKALLRYRLLHKSCVFILARFLRSWIQFLAKKEAAAPSSWCRQRFPVLCPKASPGGQLASHMGLLPWAPGLFGERCFLSKMRHRSVDLGGGEVSVPSSHSSAPAFPWSGCSELLPKGAVPHLMGDFHRHAHNPWGSDAQLFCSPYAKLKVNAMQWAPVRCGQHSCWGTLLEVSGWRCWWFFALVGAATCDAPAAVLQSRWKEKPRSLPFKQLEIYSE